MAFWNSLKLRLGAASPDRIDPAWEAVEWVEEEPEGRDTKRLLLVIGLGLLSWVATYVGMLELIEANLGDLSLVHKVIIGFSVGMLMTMIIWLLDKMFAPTDAFTRICYIAGYLFLSLISVGFGFGFYWKVLESRGEASRSAEGAITQVQGALFAASTRLGQLQSTLDQLTKVSEEKAEVERSSGKSCPNSGPGDGPRRKMREDDAERFKFASDFVKGRAETVKSDMTALDVDLQKIINDDRSLIDPRTGNRNEFLRAVGRKLDLTVTGFNAFRSDPQLKQIRTDLGDRAEKTTIAGPRGSVIHCPDPQLQMALRGVVGAIDGLPELQKPKIAAVEGSEAVIEAFRRLTTSFFGLLTFNPPPSADELRDAQLRRVQAVEGSGQAGQARRAAILEQSSGLAKRDYVPLGVAIFVDLCLLLVSIGRPVNRFLGLERSMREAEKGPVYPMLARFREIHADQDAAGVFEVFRDVIFDANGKYYVAVPLKIPKQAPNHDELRREAHNIANFCYTLEDQGILKRPRSVVPAMVVRRQLKRRASKFVECYGNSRPPRYRRGWRAVRSIWAETPEVDRPEFKVYQFKKGKWPRMITNAVMGASRHVGTRNRPEAGAELVANGRYKGNGHATPAPAPDAAGLRELPRAGKAEFGDYAREISEAASASDVAHVNGVHHPVPNGRAAGFPVNGGGLAQLHAPAQEAHRSGGGPSDVEVEKISGWFRRSKRNA